MTKSEKLQLIATEIESCVVCQHEKSGKAVPGEGASNAKIVFLGEAPGKEEAQLGRPFIGRSGKLLRKLLSENGINEKNVFITSPVKYLPDRGTPTKADINHGKQHLYQQLSVIQPKVVVLMGKTACYAMLGREVPVLRDHGTVLEKDGISYFLTLHPAAAVRFQKFKSLLVDDFTKLKKLTY